MKKGLPQQTGQSSCDPFFDVDKNKSISCRTEFGAGWEFVAGYHSHTKSPKFSRNRDGENINTDENWTKENGPLYLGAPNGDVSKLDQQGNETNIPPPPPAK